MKEQIGVMLSSSEVENRISEMAAAIDKAYEGKTIHLIGILKGSVFFMCELAKRMKSPVTMDFMSVSSYGDGTKSSGIVKLNKDLDESIEGKDVIIVEDILDSGRTLSYLVKLLGERKPASLEAVLFQCLRKENRQALRLQHFLTSRTEELSRLSCI